MFRAETCCFIVQKPLLGCDRWGQHTARTVTASTHLMWWTRSPLNWKPWIHTEKCLLLLIMESSVQQLPGIWGIQWILRKKESQMYVKVFLWMVKPAMSTSVSQTNPNIQQGTDYTVRPGAFAQNGQAFFYSQLSRRTTCVKEAASSTLSTGFWCQIWCHHSGPFLRSHS